MYVIDARVTARAPWGLSAPKLKCTSITRRQYVLWIDWVIVAFLALGTIGTITQVGKERKPIDPGQAALTTIINVSVIIALILTHWEN